MNPDTPDSLLISKYKPLAITFTLTNFLTFLSILSPFMLTFFIIMLSIMYNKIVKGLLFLMGLVILSFITYLMKNILREKQDQFANPLCNILPNPFTRHAVVGQETEYYSSPITSTVLLGYISSYLIFPMYINNELNNALLVTLVILFVTNACVEMTNKCGSLMGLILGSIIGISFGLLYYGMIVASGNNELAYFAGIKSTSQNCSLPSKQYFRCTKKLE